MSNKRYYWLKLKEDFFEEDTISWIEDQPNGKEYSLFYLKLCLKSLKTDGILIRNVGEMLIPYDTKTLSKITNTDIDTVMVAMELFKRIGLIQIFDNGEIFLTQLKNMVGSETDKAELMRKKRAKDKLIESKHNENGNIVTKALPNCYTEKEKEKEKELDLELDIEDKKADCKKEESEKNAPTSQEIVDAYNETCVSLPRVAKITDKRKRALKKISSKFSMEDIRTVFKKAQESSFLNGSTDKWSGATFDWLVKEDNIVKVIEGNYDDKNAKRKNRPNRSYNLDEFQNYSIFDDE